MYDIIMTRDLTFIKPDRGMGGCVYCRANFLRCESDCV